MMGAETRVAQSGAIGACPDRRGCEEPERGRHDPDERGEPPRAIRQGVRGPATAQCSKPNSVGGAGRGFARGLGAEAVGGGAGDGKEAGGGVDATGGGVAGGGAAVVAGVDPATLGARSRSGE